MAVTLSEQIYDPPEEMHYSNEIFLQLFNIYIYLTMHVAFNKSESNVRM